MRLIYYLFILIFLFNFSLSSGFTSIKADDIYSSSKSIYLYNLTDLIIEFVFSNPIVIAFLIVFLAFLIYIFNFLIKNWNKESNIGIKTMNGTIGKIIDIKDDNYQICCYGEIWSATSSEKLKIGDRIVIDKIEGLIAHIRRK